MLLSLVYDLLAVIFLTVTFCGIVKLDIFFFSLENQGNKL